MLSKEKIIIRFNKVTQGLSFHFIFWLLAYSFYVFLTGDQHIFKIYIQNSNHISVYILITFLSLFNALVFSIIDLIFSDRIMRFFPVRLMMFFKSLLYFSTAFLIILTAAYPSMELNIHDEFNDLILEIPTRNTNLLRFMVYFYVASFLNSFIKGIIKRIGKGNLNHWLLGFLNKPHEQERIFMFIDLKGSTTLAEKLMHKKFSHLVQDVFNDLSMIDNYRGEIYQYLGDGAIISWDLKTGLKNNNCLHAYFAFSKVLNKRKRYYNRKYGIEPKFKAGIHYGKVMVLQVGQIRRDISYNGDTLNTAARIESKCNEFKQNLMISGDLYGLLDSPSEFRFKNVGNIQLRGKKKGTEIYGVALKSKQKKK